MALTPTTLIATTGIMNGDGFAINSSQTTQINSVTTNSLIVALGNLQPYTSGANTVAGLATTLNSLPSFLTNSSSTASNVLSQAQNMLPGAGTVSGNKNLLQLFNGATTFGSATAEYAAALADFKTRTFSDLGIGVNNFTGMLTTSVGSLIPALAAGPLAIASQAKTLVTSAVGSLPGAAQLPSLNLPSLPPVPGVPQLPDPGTISDNQLSLGSVFAKLNPSAGASGIVGGGLQSVGNSMQNFGNLFDFKNLALVSNPNTTAQAMVSQLQKQGVADTYGINDKILAAGYDPKNLGSVPDSVLKNVLSTVTGDDLKKIQTAMGAKPIVPIATAADFLQLSVFLPPQAQQVMGLANAGLSGIAQMGNMLTNLGTQIDNFNMGQFISSIETKSLQYLEQLTQLIPNSVEAALQPLLGLGAGIFGNPLVQDIMGTVSGIHTSWMQNINTATAAVLSTSQGQTLQTTANALYAVASTGGDTTATYAAFASAAAAINTQIASNASLKSVCDLANSGLASSADHLAKELSNLSLAGITLPINGVPVNLGTAVTPFLSFGQSLHDYGVDSLQIGHSSVLEGLATNNLTGDAIKGSLMEGRNIARSATVGKPTPSVSDTTTALTSAPPVLHPESVVWDKTDIVSMASANSQLDGMIAKQKDWIGKYLSGASQTDKNSLYAEQQTIISKQQQLLVDLKAV